MNHRRITMPVLPQNLFTPRLLKRAGPLALTAAVVMLSAEPPALTQTQPKMPPASEIAPPNPDDYHLNRGDVVEILVYGFPELRQKSTVELNGEVSLLPSGRVKISGMTIAEAQAAIRKLITAKPLRQKFPDGRDTLTVVAADDVNITIAEYRPVYVSGDIARPGELPFRPGLTVRQAIALAGGFDVMRYRLVNPFIESADLKGKQEVLWTDMAKVRIQIARLQAELDDNQGLETSVLKDVPLATGFAQQLLETEAATLRHHIEDFSREKVHLQGLTQLAEERVRTAKATVDNEEQGMAEDKKGYAELLQFNQRGTIPVLHMMDIRRNQYATSTRALQAHAALGQARRDQTEAARNLERFESARLTALLEELQAANVRAGDLQAELSANTEKLTHTSLLKSRLLRGPGAKAIIQVFRLERNTRQQIDASEDTLLLPGDTIEIGLQNEFDVEMGRAQDGLVRSAKGPDPVFRFGKALVGDGLR
jgi:polysaccharide export outer membrane protein